MQRERCSATTPTKYTFVHVTAKRYIRVPSFLFWLECFATSGSAFQSLAPSPKRRQLAALDCCNFVLLAGKKVGSYPSLACCSSVAAAVSTIAVFLPPTTLHLPSLPPGRRLLPSFLFLSLLYFRSFGFLPSLPHLTHSTASPPSTLLSQLLQFATVSSSSPSHSYRPPSSHVFQ